MENYLQRPDCFNCKFYSKSPAETQGYCKMHHIKMPATGGSCGSYTPYKTISDEAINEINHQIRTSRIGYSPLEALINI